MAAASDALLIAGFGDEGRRLLQAASGQTQHALPAALRVGSVLVSGRTGIGKALVVRAVARAAGCALVRIHPGRVAAAAAAGGGGGGRHHALRRQLAAVPHDRPAVAWLVDAELLRGLHARAVAEHVRSAPRGSRCLVVMTTRHPDRVAPELRRACADHIALLPPAKHERLLLARWRACDALPPDVLDAVAAAAHGMGAAELFAALDARAEDRRRPAARAPDVRWADVGGLDAVIEQLTEAIAWPLLQRERFRRLGIRPPRGVLLHGPPGTGKTLLARAAAAEVAASFVAVAIPDLVKGEVGESEKALAALFEAARRAPTILFLDEIEAVFGARDRAGETGRKLVSQLFLEMDELPEDAPVVVLAATNEPALVDPAILRPGRLDKVIHIPRPGPDARLDILRRATRHLQIEDPDALLPWVATHPMSGAEIKAAVRGACYAAIQRGSRVLARPDFDCALESMQDGVF
ncbi:hypothetical protein H4R18_001186 [Coemansia javaensis]|uniref:AAA+ ATPase domain-containing protein n=1 Tax=Coemansia javaensis TaxID=2761396 RepID=A0A9W8LJI3_9FUNG|nr:hypothetical protein H4R18_001186 [Coemansia javaensis]